MISYSAGFKYQLRQKYTVELLFSPVVDIEDTFIKFYTYGIMEIMVGYAWDGPSGPTFDTKSFMRGSLIHDCLYQLIRKGFLTYEPYRKLADEELIRICREDGMNRVRAWGVYRAVRWFGITSASNQRRILVAP